MLVASRNYIERHGMPVADLSDHATIGNFYLDPAAAGAGAGQLPARVPVLELIRDKERFVVPIWRRFASTDHSMMLDLVRQGVAIAPIAAVRMVDDLRSGKLVRILPDYEVHDPSTLYALYTERLAISPKLKVSRFRD